MKTDAMQACVSRVAARVVITTWQDDEGDWGWTASVDGREVCCSPVAQWETDEAARFIGEEQRLVAANLYVYHGDKEWRLA